MLKVSSVLADTPSQSLPPLVDSSINDAVIKVAPFRNLVVLSNGRRHGSGGVDSLLQNAPDRVNSFIILFAPYPFATLSTSIKTLSSSDNILFINRA